MAAEYLKIGIMATYTTQEIWYGWYMCFVNCLMVSSVFFLTQSRSKVKSPVIVRRTLRYLTGSHGITILGLPFPT